MYSFLHVLCILLLAVFTRIVYSDWGLKDMGRSYFDSNAKKEEDPMSVEFYKPVRKNQLCEAFPDRYTDCKENEKLNILIIDQLPVMATQLGCIICQLYVYIIALNMIYN